MGNMVSLDAPIADGGELHDIVGDAREDSKVFDPYDRTGKCPEPLKSSWMMNFRPTPPPRKTVITYFLDGLDGLTITKCPDRETAVRTQKKLREIGIVAMIRPYVLDEEERQAESARARESAQLGLVDWDVPTEKNVTRHVIRRKKS